MSPLLLAVLCSVLVVLAACRTDSQHDSGGVAAPAAPAPSHQASATATPSTTESRVPPHQASAVPTGGSQAEGYAVLKGCLLTLQVADTPAERARGLMDRTSLPGDHGMLFVHQEAGPWPFWMLNTLVPLDVVWLDGDRRVVDIQTMRPEPGVPADKLAIYRPRADALYTLEVNAGLAARLGLAAGEQVGLYPQPADPPEGVPPCS